MDYVKYFCLWTGWVILFSIITRDIYGAVNHDLKVKQCKLKTRNLSPFQQAFIITDDWEKARMKTTVYPKEKDAVYGIIYNLQIIEAIICLINIFALDVGFILAKTVMKNVIVYEIVHGAFFSIAYLIDIVAAIVVIRKAFKNI